MSYHVTLQCMYTNQHRVINISNPLTLFCDWRLGASSFSFVNCCDSAALCNNGNSFLCSNAEDGGVWMMGTKL